MLNKYFFILSIFTLFTSPAFAAEDPSASCGEAVKLFQQQDINGALEEARWCVEALEQLKQQQATSLFPDQIAGFIGGEIQNQKAMGFSMIERNYNKDGQTITVGLNKGSGQGMGGFAAIAQMGMMGAGKKLRIQRRMVTDMTEGSSVQFMLSLKSGGMLRFESSNTDHATVLDFAQQFPIAELDESL